jgi:hypothetical protein
MNFDWQENGFVAPPSLKTAEGTEKLYRAWGGNPRRKWGNQDLPGVCFSLDRACSRRQAEMLYSVMEYQNPVHFLTEFAVPKKMLFWSGKVHPGDPRALLGNVSGNQILIERAYLTLVKEVSTVPLVDDIGAHVVYSGRLPRIES